MTEVKPFRPDKAAHVQFGELHTDFILSICLPDPELMVGDALAVLVVTTVEGQRVGMPIGLNALTHLQKSLRRDCGWCGKMAVRNNKRCEE